MKYLALIIVAVCFLTINTAAQLADRMIEYCPAPGQLINTNGAGSYQAAESVVGSLNGVVSLGAFGGHVVYGFNQPLKNDPANPYGVDFVIFGNVQPDWAEPGIVMVMKDGNKNGLPDDIWYELAGSEYFFSTTKHQSAVTYFNPINSASTDIAWTTNEGNNGYIFSNSFHKQNYFPSQQFFGGIIQETESFTGTLLADQIDLTNPAMVKCYHRRFGYADNNIRKNSNFNNPDNPYTSEIEGCGGDAMDIAWAVDEEGNYFEIDQIDFIKIYTGVLANAGWCGEISTEICGIADVDPSSSLRGPIKCLVINRPIGKLITNDSLQLEALPFQMGRVWRNQPVNWTTDNSRVATVNSTGLLLLKNEGSVQITVSLVSDPSTCASTTFDVITPTGIEIATASPVLRIGEASEISAHVFDASNNMVTGLKIGWKIQDNAVLSIFEKNGKQYIKGLAEGNTIIEAFLKERPEIKTAVALSVLPESSHREVYITVKDENSTFVPRNKFSISNFNLNPFVDKANGNYGMDKIEGVTVAHAIAGVFIQTGLKDDFRFRDDEKGMGKLYAWKIPKGDSLSVEYVYGYGGYSANPALLRCWIVLLNNTQIVSGFEQHLLKKNDELILYHVSDITSDWIVSCFIPNKSELAINDTLEVYSTELTCSMNPDNEVEVKSSSPIKFQQVWVNDQAAYFNGDPVVTDESGTAALRFAESGAKKIATGIDEIVVNVQQPLSINKFVQNCSVKIWPQPASAMLNISFSSSGNCIRMIDLWGKCVLTDMIFDEKQVQVSTYGIIPGLYILQVSSSTGITNHKIIIQ